MEAFRLFSKVSLFLGVAFIFGHSSAQRLDSTTELAIDEGWLLVKSNCVACHSAQIIIQNSGTRDVWKSRIEWMQNTQGLGELSDEIENAIISYLAKNYGQKESTRRVGLPDSLMPVNPYDY